MKFRTLMPLGLVAVLISACVSKSSLKDEVAKALKEDPKILAEAIEAQPVAVVKAFQNAIRKAQDEMAVEREKEEEKKLEEYYDKPLAPKIRADESFRGTKGAPITLVEYSDFECPYCSRGYKVVMELMEKYSGKIAFIYKHLPLSFHPQAMIASQYYEAIRLQDANKAFKFHDAIFDNQGKLKNGEPFLKEQAKKVGADMSKLQKDLNSSAVMERIKEDMAEAAQFEISGTPGFIINGVPVKGAYPAEHFVGIIEKLVEKGKLKL